MTPERWREVESLFHRALALDGRERRLFLDRACGPSGELRLEVDSLLEALEDTSSFGGAASHLVRELISRPQPEDSRPEPPPSQIGPYRVLEKIGEGGMGSVYLAEQGEPLQRLVALKMLHAHGPDALRRFELERESLARMAHGSIAKVFDAGATDRGRPYVVLEYIRGAPITDYCDGHRSSLRDRVKLMIRVAQGVGHAHEKGVIHRDLKPSNILVDESGEPKIIDFGIAKALRPWSASSRARTGSFLRLGSLAYMSPEALLDGSKAVDVRSDIYALGVILSELLAGVRPPLRRASKGDALGTSPPRPSRRFEALSARDRERLAERRGLSAPALIRRLRPELDWIVLRASAEEPGERYATVRQFAADLERWLDRRPIDARPASTLYLATRLVRRHAVASTLALFLALALLATAISSTHLYRRAEASRAEAEDLVAFMLDDLGAELEPMGHLDLLESVSHRSLAYFESTRGGPRSRSGGPSQALRQIGRVMVSRGELGAAETALERALEFDIVRSRDHPRVLEPQLALAQTLLQVADLDRHRGDLRRAAGRLERALELLRPFADAEPSRREPGDTEELRLVRAQIHAALGSTRRLQGEVEAAGALLRRAIDEVRSLDAAASKPEARHVLGMARYRLGLLEAHSFGDAEASIHHFEAGAEIYRDLVIDEPGAALYRLRLAVLLGHGLASSYRSLGRHDEARAANAEALSIFEVLVEREPRNDAWTHSLGWEWLRRGHLDRDAGELERAADAYRRSIAIQERLSTSAAEAPTAWLDGLATAYEALADLEHQLEPIERALTIRRRIRGEDDATGAYFEAHLAALLVRAGELRRRRGDPAGARQALTEARALLAALDSGEHGEHGEPETLARQAEARDGARTLERLLAEADRAVQTRVEP